jgi:ABC-2 type transport system permease protein
LPELSQPSPRPLPSNAEAAILWRLRYRTGLGLLRGMLVRSRLRATLVVGLSLFFWIGLFILFRDGHRLLMGYPAIVEQLFNLFFFTLLILLTFSSALILYSGLYRSEEAGFLLTTGLRERRIFLYKFQEAAWFSSWGFLLLSSPMLVAYGVEMGAPWYYYALIIPFMASFAFIPSSIGAIICLVVIDRLPAVRRHVLGIMAALTAALAVYLVWSVLTLPKQNLLTPRWFHDVSQRLQVVEQNFLPSWWLTSGLLETARGDTGSWSHRPWAQGVLFFALLLANALFFLMLAYRLADRVYRRSYQSLTSEKLSHKRTGVSWIDRCVYRLVWFLPRNLRHLIVKDVRLFRRDPLQWTQVVIFFGLLLLYFLNIRSFTPSETLLQPINMIGFLNVAVIGLILSTFTTRFIFPMISLEGRRFWILGLLPIRRETILWSKFLFACVGSAIPCCGLILLSDVLLPLPAIVRWIHQLDCLVLCAGLSGIAVGLGAAIPDLREAAPSKIAAGFGGTLNLVLSAVFILAVVLITAIPCHLYIAGQVIHSGNAWIDYLLEPPRSLGVGSGMALALGVLATVIPLRSGFRAFRNLEL